MAHNDQSRNFGVTVLAPDYTRVLGTIADYQTVSCTWSYAQTSTAVLVGVERGLMTEVMNARERVVPITFSSPGLPRWTGRVVYGNGTRALGKTGLVQATLVDERKWLSKILTAPVPGLPWSTQSATAYDKRTGQLVQVAKAYVTANVNRLAAEGYPTPIRVVPSSETSPLVTISARLKPIDEEFKDVFKQYGYDWDVRLWLPGDPVPPGMTLTSACILVDVRQGRDKGYVKFSDAYGGIEQRVLATYHPEALGTVVGGPTTVADDPKTRILSKVMATDGRIAALGQWGFPEQWVEDTNDDVDIRTQSGQDKNADAAGKSMLDIDISDRFPWVAGPDADYWIGDLARASIAGTTVSDRITRITATDNEEGFRVSAAFGDEQESESADVQLTRRVAALTRAIQAMEAGR